MPKDRRRGRRPHRPVVGAPSAARQQSPQPVAALRQSPVQKTPPVAKVAATRQPVAANPHLVKDLRNIGMVAVTLAILLVVLSVVIR